MTTDGTFIDLGFAEAHVPVGTHVCQIYEDATERDDALLRFLSRGLLNREATACFSDNISQNALQTWFAKNGLSLDEERESGRFTLAGARSVYFEEGRFDPDRMLARLKEFHEDCVTAGRPGARVIGEMDPGIRNVLGGDRLFEYEAGVNHLVITHPVTAVCQYDVHDWDGATIMDILSVHPMMLVRGNVIQNPFFLPPEEIVRR